MIKTKNVNSIDDIPSEWVFNHYLPLPEVLSGQDVKINSVFNPNDKTPSMFVFYSAEKSIYMYSDFSTGKKGNAVDLVRELFNLSNNWEAIQRIENDFKKGLVIASATYTNVIVGKHGGVIKGLGNKKLDEKRLYKTGRFQILGSAINICPESIPKPIKEDYKKKYKQIIKNNKRK